MTDSAAQPPTARSGTAWMAGLILLNVSLLVTVAILLVQNRQADRHPIDGITSLVAKVNGRPIYARDLLSAIRISSETPSLENIRRHLQEMIRAEVVGQQSVGITVSEETIQERWLAITQQFSGDDLSPALEKAGMTKVRVENRIRKNLQAEMWLRNTGKTLPNARELASFYEAHRDDFTLPEAVLANHFASIFPPRGTPLELLTKGDLVRDVQKQLLAGESFAQLIETYSDDPAKKLTNGSLSWFRRERMDAALAETAFRLPIGESSQPVQTRFGFHLLMVNDRRPMSALSYEEAESELRQRCRDEMELKKMRETIEKLVQTSKVEIFDPHLRNLSL